MRFLSLIKRDIVLLVALPLAGCFSSSSSEVVTPLSSQLQKEGFVSELRVTSMPPDAPASLEGKLKLMLSRAVLTCATGHHPLRLEVAVTKYKGQNAAMTLLVGSSNVIEGTAKLVDPATQGVVGDFDITRSTGGGGIIAAVGMSGSQDQMADAFAHDVCRKAFGRGPDDQALPPK